MPDLQSTESGHRIYGAQLRAPITFTGRLVFGLIVLTLGVIWTLDNLGIVDSTPLLRWWPALLMAAGLARLTGVGARQSVVSGTVMTTIGAILLAGNLHLMHARILWPLALITLGASLVFRSVRAPALGGSGGDVQAEVHNFAMMAGLVLKNVSQQFRGGDLSAMMGGIQLDLRGAAAAGPEVVLDVFTWWGGIDITVPPDWRVVTHVTPIMGGYDDHTKPYAGEAKTTLVIRGVVIMGGIEVKN